MPSGLYPKLNPISEKLNELGFISLLPDLDANFVPDRIHQDFMDRANHLITVPYSRNYLPLFRPDGVRFNDWVFNLQKAFARSAYHFMADIWTQILVKKQRGERSIYILWDEEIPTPTPATSLFWLMMCEAWPLPISLNQFPAGGVEYISGVADIFRPQPFLLPQSQHRSTSAIHPVGLVTGSDNPRHLFDIEMGRSLTRTDMNNLNKSPSWWQPLFMPSKPNLIEDHIVTRSAWPAMSRRPDIQYNTFIGRPIALETAGYALQSIMESNIHLQHLWSMRAMIMNAITTRPGIPSADGNIYGPVGGWIRSFSENQMTLAYNLENKHGDYMIPFAMGGGVNVNDVAVLDTVPMSIPAIWLGFTGEGIWEKGNETCKSAWNWAEAYLASRNVGLNQFMGQNTPMLQHEDEALRHRTNRLKRAGLIVDKSSSAKTMGEKIKEAFVALKIQE